MSMMKAMSKRNILVRIRPADEFGKWSTVELIIPADFAIEDFSSKKVYYDCWKASHSLPDEHLMHSSFEDVKEVLHFSEMMLITRNGKAYVSFVGNTNMKKHLLMDTMESIFHQFQVSFDA